jgi:hypothetical protein
MLYANCTFTYVLNCGFNAMATISSTIYPPAGKGTRLGTIFQRTSPETPSPEH